MKTYQSLVSPRTELFPTLRPLRETSHVVYQECPLS